VESVQPVEFVEHALERSKRARLVVRPGCETNL
jgi:hypothetical protein